MSFLWPWLSQSGVGRGMWRNVCHCCLCGGHGYSRVTHSGIKTVV